MIFKIDHVSMATVDLDDEIAKSIDMGYTLNFKQVGLQNPKIKCGLMGRFVDTYSMALLDRRMAFPVEFVDYGHVGDEGGCVSFDMSLQKVVIRVDDIAKSIGTWSMFGFSTNEDNVFFKSPLGSYSFSLQLKNGVGRTTMLDDKDGNSIALITSSIHRDKERLGGSGFYVTDIEEIVVNNKKLNVFFARGYAGEIIELIGI
jgi:hypothetical protein